MGYHSHTHIFSQINEDILVVNNLYHSNTSMEFSLIRRFLEIGRTVPYITSTNIPGRLNVTIFCSLSPGIYLKYKKNSSEKFENKIKWQLV